MAGRCATGSRPRPTDGSGGRYARKEPVGAGDRGRSADLPVNRLAPPLDPLAAHRLSVSDLTVSYHRVPALHHIAFEVQCGQCVALLWPNGAGKSTWLKTLAGLLPRETGRIAFAH